MVLAVWAPLEGPLSMPVTVKAVTAFLWLAIVTGVGAPLLLFALIKRRGPARGTSLLFVVPAVTALASWPLLGRTVGPTAFAGLAVAGTGLWLARRRSDRQLGPQEVDGHRPGPLRGRGVMEHRPGVVERVAAARVGLEPDPRAGDGALDGADGLHRDVVVG